MFKNKAFTLIELLVVIAIIGILSSVVLASLSGARESARDSKRKQDLHQIYTAMQMYINDNGHLPTTSSYGESNDGGWDSSSQGDFMTFLDSAGYMSDVPVDPINDDPNDPSSGTGKAYFYYCYTRSGQDDFVLGARLEKDGGTYYYHPEQYQPVLSCKN